MFDLIAGTCAIESEHLTLRTAEHLRNITDDLGINLIYKGSYDKANRTSSLSARGVGIDEGLRILERVREITGCKVITDVHDVTQIEAVSQAVDILQTPAFLCRQTDFIRAVAATQKPVNIKKGQFLNPEAMIHVANKAMETGNTDIWLCERGTCFGYGDLVSDMRSLVILKRFGFPVVYDVTHSIQRIAGEGKISGGDRRFVAPLARAAIAIGVDKLFMETHPEPDDALSDRATSYRLSDMKPLLTQLKRIHEATANG